jgi:hypothetical protein
LRFIATWAAFSISTAALTSCSAPSDDKPSIEPRLEQLELQDIEQVQNVWEELVKVTKPCENSAKKLTDALDKGTMDNAGILAKSGQLECAKAMQSINELAIPESINTLIFSRLIIGLRECHDAQQARKKFLEAADAVIQGDRTQWRVSLVQTASMLTQERTKDCISTFIEAGAKP